MATRKNKKNELKHTKFIEAFCKLFKCTLDDIESQVRAPGGSVLVMHKTDLYQIDTYEYLLEGTKDDLEDEQGAVHVPPDMWLRVAGNAIISADFYLSLLNDFRTPYDLQVLNTAISVTLLSTDKPRAFWEGLKRLDKMGTIYPKAIMSAAKQYDVAMLADKMLEIKLFNGSKVYNALEDGIFEKVSLLIDEEEDIDFYIYSQDIAAWDNDINDNR